LLLDTSGLLAFFDTGAKQHADAVIYMNAAPTLLTHSYVLAEFVALATARGHSRAAMLTFVTGLQSNPDVEVVYVDETLHNDGLTFLQSRLDKTWSLCDAVSFLLMQQRGLTDALTTDHHFEQAGFVRLLKP